jgi:hypothetical protein
MAPYSTVSAVGEAVPLARSLRRRTLRTQKHQRSLGWDNPCATALDIAMVDEGDDCDLVGRRAEESAAMHTRAVGVADGGESRAAMRVSWSKGLHEALPALRDALYAYSGLQYRIVTDYTMTAGVRLYAVCRGVQEET